MVLVRGGQQRHSPQRKEITMNTFENRKAKFERFLAFMVIGTMTVSSIAVAIFH
jgi:hypothetical protein